MQVEIGDTKLPKQILLGRGRLPIGVLPENSCYNGCGEVQAPGVNLFNSLGDADDR